MRRRRVDPSPRISHDRVVELLVDYHLGRLNPALNHAIEMHVAQCSLCQLQGLAHTGTEKRVIQRRIRKAKPMRRRLISRRGRVVLFLLVVVLLAQVVLYEIFFGHSHFAHFFGEVISPVSPVLRILSIAGR